MANKSKISPLQVYSTKDFNGLGHTNNLMKKYLTEPETMDTVLSYVFGYSKDNVLTLLTGGYGKTEYISNREYNWDLHIQSEKAIECAVDSPDVNGNLGRGNTPFRIILTDKWFSYNDNLLSDNIDVSVHVIDEPRQVGNAYEYTVQLNNPNSSAFIDPALISAGARWTKESTTVGEESYEGGSTGYVTPIKLTNQLSTLRKSYKCTGEAAQSVMVVELCSPDGQKTKFWSKLQEWTELAAWYKEQDRTYLYSTYSKDPVTGENKLFDKKNGDQPIYHGAGLREQIAPANKYYYTTLTYEILQDILFDLSYAANQWGGDTKFVALTGQGGMKEFDACIKRYNSSAGITVTTHGTFVEGDSLSLASTGHFKKVTFVNGQELIIKHFAAYDDKVRNRELDPKSGWPLESYRFTILNFGSKEGKSNITKISMKNRENVMWSVDGSTSPGALPKKSISTTSASGYDGYTVHYLDNCGIRLRDPLSCCEIVKRVAG